MKADKIIRNAKIFTSNPDNPRANALVVEAGLSGYEGEVVELGGKFIMPGIIDSHVHINTNAAFKDADSGVRFECNGKQEALRFMGDYATVQQWIDYCVHEKIYSYLHELDRHGKLPVYIDGCYVNTQPAKLKDDLEGLKRFNREFNMDDTLKLEIAAMVTPSA